MSFIDVGQGDAILIDRGETDILVDGGPTSASVLAYLQGQGVGNIDLLVATHPHADHIGGLPDVLARYQVNEIWVNGDTPTSQTYQNFAAAVAAEGATLREVSVLLTGDATSDSEASMLAAGLALDSDVLKVGHHGSSTSTSGAFLATVTPKDAVISVGAGNTYGHPAQETLDRLAAAAATVHRTDQDGTVVLTSDCNTYSVTSSTPTPPPPTSEAAPPKVTPTGEAAPPPSDNCDPAYPDVCIPPPPPDLDCGDIPYKRFRVLPPDPHRFDGDKDGIGCES